MQSGQMESHVVVQGRPDKNNKPIFIVRKIKRINK